MTFYILGSNVESSARSPILWNSAFGELGIANSMVAQDFESTQPDLLLKKISNLDDFEGTLLGYPLKKTGSQLVKNLDCWAKETGFNFLNKNEGDLQGVNYDGIAAVKSIIKLFDINFSVDTKILVLGGGSTAHSIIFTLTKHLGLELQNISVLNRRPVTRTSPIFPIQLSKFPNGEFDLIINATPCGSKSHPKSLPFGYSEMEGIILKTRYLFNVNYGAKRTSLETICINSNIPYADGNTMNLLQAALCFQEFAAKDKDLNRILAIMEGAVS